MRDKLFSFWFPRSYDLGDGVREHVKFIIGIAYISIAVNICYFFFNLQHGIPNTPAVCSILGNGFLLLLVRWSRNYLVPACGLLALVGGYIAILVFLFRSFPFTVLLWLPVYSIMSVYVVGKWLGGLWTIGLTGIVLYIIQYGEHSANVSYQIDRAQINPVIIISVVLTVAGAYYSSILFMNYISKLTTQLDQQNRELVHKNQAISENVTEKKTLISIICHDIANPLSVILGFSQAADRTNDVNKVKSYSAKVAKAAIIMKHIIEDVRNLQAIDTGKFQVSLAPTNLEDVFKNIELVFSERLKEKGLTLNFENTKNIPLWVQAEEKSLTYSVISNLISNAIKFSEPDHPITIAVTEKKGKIYLSIKDQGIGMPENIVANLFRQDKKTSRLGTQGEKGTGFGMPITKAYMEKYGGDISVFSKEKSEDQSSDDHGTTFMLTFDKVSGA